MYLGATHLCGCDDTKKDTEDTIVQGLRWLQPETSADKERIALAISLRQNGIDDPQPLFLFALVDERADRGDGRAGFVLTFGVYDEDQDVIGCVIHEEHTARDGSRGNLVEKYPVFMYYPMVDILVFPFFPIRVRAMGERIDELSWKEYSEGHTMDEMSARDFRHWAMTLPSVYVSIPEPNQTNVQVYLYDRAGHESNRVDLYHVPPRGVPGSPRGRN